MTPSDDTFWCTNPNHPVALAKWNDSQQHEVIAYHLGTGDTHLITAESAIILEILQKDNARMSAKEITRRFRASLNNPDLEFDSHDITESFLKPFQQLGFVEATRS